MIDLTAIVITLLFLFIIFIICRELTCWYWKINETIEILKDIRDLLKNKEEVIELTDVVDEN